jgi:aspartyl-tRNA(Asn)/glutamyl-tRNA(Gln) amidotransferase subunit A
VTATSTIERLQAGYSEGTRTVTDTIAATFAAIESKGAELGVFLELDHDGAQRRARELDEQRAAGVAMGALHGVPVALKANMCLRGVETNCGSRILAGYRAPYTATFVQRLIDAGAVPVGMTNMDEFAMGSSSENSAYGPVKNPWDPTRTPGGSSSGSAVAVAAGIVPLALGSDTGGSVRQPASFCGIVGFKPTYGAVSRLGLIAFASSLDQVSPFARSVADIERALTVLSGNDPLDSTSLDMPPIAALAGVRLDGLRVGVPSEYFPSDLDSSVRSCVESALDVLRAAGAECIPIELPHTPHAISTYYVVATAEASSNLARYDGVRYGTRVDGDGSLQGMFAATRNAGFGDEVKRRILLGTYALSSGYYDAWYGRALKVRRLLTMEFEAAWQTVDVIVGPTSPTVAFPLGERAQDPVAMYQADALTVPASLAGLPAVSIPCGLVEEAGTPLPVGLQIIGRSGQDAFVLATARACEALLPKVGASPMTSEVCA